MIFNKDRRKEASGEDSVTQLAILTGQLREIIDQLHDVVQELKEEMPSSSTSKGV